MNKTDLIKAVAKKTQLTQDGSKEVIDAVIESITEGLKTDGIAQITGFGTFRATDVPERLGHNPKNPKEKITIKAHKQISFSTGEKLKADVNA